MALVEPALILALFVVGAVGGLIAYELRRLHQRIDRYAARMEGHIDEGRDVHTAIARVETKIDMHRENGHNH